MSNQTTKVSFLKSMIILIFLKFHTPENFIFTIA